MQNLEVSGAVRPIYWSLGVKRLNRKFGGPHSLYGTFGDEKIFLNTDGIKKTLDLKKNDEGIRAAHFRR